MKYRLRTYGDPVLREKAAPIPRIDSGVRALADAMLGIMADKRGVGLAAQQVGQTLNLCVIHIPPSLDVNPADGSRLHAGVDFPLILVNPAVTARSGQARDSEGCLSVPEIWAPVTRAADVTVAYLDLEGHRRELCARGLLARALQHEIDHLNGVLFVDRVSPVKKISLAGTLRRMRQSRASEPGLC